MKIIERENDTLVEFGNISTRLKILFVFAAISGLSFIFIPLSYSELIIEDPKGHVGLIILSLIFIIVGILVCYRYLKRVLQKESVLISRDSLTIINSAFMRKRERPYEISNIAYLNYMGKAKKTDHPLKGQSFDYLGFETQELVIAEVNNEGNLSFMYGDKLISFGRDVYSWDAEKINTILTKVTEGKLSVGNLPEENNDEDASFEPGGSKL